MPTGESLSGKTADYRAQQRTFHIRVSILKIVYLFFAFLQNTRYCFPAIYIESDLLFH
jgi:hypothetical protein